MISILHPNKCVKLYADLLRKTIRLLTIFDNFCHTCL